MSLATRHPAAPLLDRSVGHALGHDHGLYGLTPDATLLGADPSVRAGLLAARQRYGSHTRRSTSLVLRWLALRSRAWLCGEPFDTELVNPAYLSQLQTDHCPVTRERLFIFEPSLDQETDAAPPPPLTGLGVVCRIDEGHGYAAGNLAMLGSRAAAARQGLDHDTALEQVRHIDAHGLGVSAGLNALQWARLAILLSFVTPLAHARAASLPLLVLPPNRLHLLNPIQGLQALLTQQLLRSGWSSRIPAIEALMPTASLRRELRGCCATLLPKVLAVRPDGPVSWRRALEDAWRHPRVQQQWRQFALQLDSERTQQLLERIAAEGLSAQRVRTFSAVDAPLGWQPAAHRRRMPPAPWPRIAPC